MPRPQPPAPADLSEPTAALWPGLVDDLAVMTGAAEVDVLQLAEALRVLDRLAAVRSIIEAEGLTVTGSKGQTRPHPLLAVESGLRRDLAAGFARLGLEPRARSPYVHLVRDGRIRERG